MTVKKQVCESPADSPEITKEFENYLNGKFTEYVVENILIRPAAIKFHYGKFLKS